MTMKKIHRHKLLGSIISWCIILVWSLEPRF